MKETNIIESESDGKLPFALRLIEAEYASYFKKNHSICFDKLSLLLTYVNIHLSSLQNEEELSKWKKRKKRVQLSLSNQLILLHDYLGAISILKEMILDSQKEEKAEELYLIALLSRVYLQAGNMRMSSKLNSFLERKLLKGGESGEGEKKVEEGEKSEENNSKLLILFNNAICEFYKGNFEKSSQFYEEALKLDSNNLAVINNLSICKLNLCDISGSIKILEDTLFGDPKNNLEEILLQNLASLYELGYENLQEKKKDLNNLIRKNSNLDLSF